MPLRFIVQTSGDENTLVVRKVWEDDNESDNENVVAFVEQEGDVADKLGARMELYRRVEVEGINWLVESLALKFFKAGMEYRRKGE